MFYYQAYGLTIGADEALVGLSPANVTSPVDVTLHLRSEPKFDTPTTTHLLDSGPERGPDGQSIFSLWKIHTSGSTSYFQLRFVRGSEAVEFTIDSAGTEVWAAWTESLGFDDLTALLLRPVLAAVLWLRGITCLHGSVVAIEGRAIALVGDATTGKSTLAAAFAARGHAVLADDVAALVDRGTSFAVQPAFPSLAVWPDSAQTVMSGDLPRVWTQVEKRSIGLSTGAAGPTFRFEPRPLPLGAIYFLGPRQADLTAATFEPVTQAKGLMKLIGNRYSRTRLSAEHSAQEFERYGRVARYVPMRLAHRPDDLDGLPAVCEAIANDLASHSEAMTPASAVA